MHHLFEFLGGPLDGERLWTHGEPEYRMPVTHLDRPELRRFTPPTAAEMAEEPQMPIWVYALDGGRYVFQGQR